MNSFISDLPLSFSLWCFSPGAWCVLGVALSLLANEYQLHSSSVKCTYCWPAHAFELSSHLSMWSMCWRYSVSVCYLHKGHVVWWNVNVMTVKWGHGGSRGLSGQVHEVRIVSAFCQFIVKKHRAQYEIFCYSTV